MTGAEVARVDTAVDPLVYLGLDPARIEVRVLFLLCQRYHLDLILGHARLIPVKGGPAQPYITRDGMLHVAHDSGQLDGMTVDEQRESENGYSATVSVWRRDMAHPFTYKGGCGIEEPQAKAGHGAAMALARAERRALRRAFDLPAYDGADEPETGEITPRPDLAAASPGPQFATADPDGDASTANPSSANVLRCRSRPRHRKRRRPGRVDRLPSPRRHPSPTTTCGTTARPCSTPKPASRSRNEQPERR